MSYKKTLIITLILCVPVSALNAQVVKLINSTRQDWAGGIAGHTGTNYSFIVEFSDFKNEPAPDTIWLGTQPVPVTTKDEHEYANTKVTRTARSVKYEINVGTHRDEYADRYPIQGQQQQTPKPIPPVNYKGVALLSYNYKGHKHYYTITKIMRNYPQQNYP